MISCARALTPVLLMFAVCVALGQGASPAGQVPRPGAAACVSGAPAAGAAARCLLDRVPPEELEAALFAAPEVADAALRALAATLASSIPGAAGTYVASASRARSRRLSAMGVWSEAQGEAFLRLQLVDAERFVDDAAFRARVLALLPGAFDPAASADLRDQMLYSINSLPGVDYASSERIELGWGAAARASGPRELPYERDALTFADDSSAAIPASIYSFPAPFLEPGAVARFMTGMRRLRPERELVALVDLPMRKAVEAEARASSWTLVETHGRAFSPWPRDPFSVLRRAGGGVAFVVRPNAQAQRADDNDMARELIQGLPARLDARGDDPRGRARRCRSTTARSSSRATRRG